MRRNVILVLLLCVLCSCSNIKTTDYMEQRYGNTKEELEEAMGSAPDQTNTASDGTEELVYLKNKYLDYTGTMTYYYMNDILLFFRWETHCSEPDEAKDIYSDIVDSVRKQSSVEGEENNSETRCSTLFSDNGKNTTIGYAEDAGEYFVSITVVDQSE